MPRLPRAEGFRKDYREGPYQLFMLVLCCLVLVQLMVEAFLDLPSEIHDILLRIDVFICTIFFFDFCLQFKMAESKWKYMVTWGWIDLVSSIPLISGALWGRAARAIRLFKLLRGVRSARELIRFLAKHRRAESALLTLVLISVVVVAMSSVLIFEIEGGRGGTIDTAADALWWTIVTISTVGYGDTYPITPAGRLVAVGLMGVGIGLFGTFTALVASWFVAPIEAEQEREMEAIRKEVTEVRRLLAEHLGVGKESDRVVASAPGEAPSDGVPGAATATSTKTVARVRRVLEGSRR